MASRKLEILIDANSLSHLSRIEINRQKTDKWLWKYLQVMTCKSVRDEFFTKVNERTSTERSIWKKIDKTKSSVISVKRIIALEKKWLSQDYYKKSLKKKDEGERHLICAAVEVVKDKIFSQMVIVSDDFTARNYFMDKVLEDIQFGQIWNTPDLLSYLFLIHDDISYENAENAMIDLIAIESMSWRKFKDKYDTQQDAMIKMRGYYIKKLQKINSLKQKY
ncbi:MAG: hypothetical protein R2825_01315 [Saprospiraceae bacterium]